METGEQKEIADAKDGEMGEQEIPELKDGEIEEKKEDADKGETPPPMEAKQNEGDDTMTE
jgi:hypothetical protein